MSGLGQEVSTGLPTQWIMGIFGFKNYLSLRYGSRGDAYFSLVKTRGSALGDSVAFLKFDRSMKEWTEVHFHCLEMEDMEKV